MAPPSLPALQPLARAAQITEFRLRTGEALRWLSTGLIPTITALGGWMTYVKLTHGAHGPAGTALLGATIASGAATGAAVVWAYVRRYPERAGAVRLDASHGLHDRITSALTFAELPADQRTPLMDAAIEDAVASGQTLSTRKAAPIKLPVDLGVAAVLGMLVVGLASLQWSNKIITYPAVATIDAVTLSPDDLDLYREALNDLAKKDQSPETQAALERFNQLIEDLSQKRLDRNEAFRRMEALEREVLKSQAADAKSLDDALKSMGDELKKNPHTKALGESLSKKDMPKAQKDLKELAQKLRDQKDKKNKLSEEDKKRLKEALANASKKHKEAIQKLQQQRENVRASLLQREQKPASEQTDEEKRLLQRDKKELERLDRELEQKERAQRQLDRLDRELSQAAEDLLRDLGLSAEDLEKGAEDINRMAQEEMSEKEKEELRQRLQELRELLRQEGQGGEEMKKRMRKFAKKARGQQGGDDEDGDGKKGQKGKKKGQGQQGDDGDDGDEDGDDGNEDGSPGKKKKGKGQKGDGEGEDGEQGKGKGKKGKGQQGDGDGDGEGSGPGGKQITLQLGQGQGQGAGQGPPGSGQGGQGKQWGSGHDDNLSGKGTSGKFGTQDVQASANDTGQGPNVSETIHGAAQRGFVGKGYKRVYADYRTKAEEAMKNEDIPPGYRFYVQRYFQLIRPRE